jgi:23S rRNA (cytosine1962-C5)-methyltransferase
MQRAETLRLRKPLDRVIRDGHPWVYRDAIEGHAAPGTAVTLVDAKGAFVARGIADEGPIAMRVFTLRDEAVEAPLFRARIERAASLRDRVIPHDTDCYRLLHGEGDRVPGFVCDLYGATAVLKTDGAGARVRGEDFAESLRPTLEARGIRTLLRRASGTRGDAVKAVLAWGEPPADVVTVREYGMALRVDLWRGQKTGTFIDQRESRARVRALSRGLRVMNLYSYTGGFSIAAGLGGAAAVETVDVAPGAIALAEESWRTNDLDASRHRAVVADVPQHLALRTRERARYDLVIADPPSFAPREDSVDAALKSYRALHASSLALVTSGGFYLAASCSSHVDRAAFADTIVEGARRAKRSLQWLDAWGAPPDHPRLPAFPEGDYLKVVLLRVE